MLGDGAVTETQRVTKTTRQRGRAGIGGTTKLRGMRRLVQAGVTVCWSVKPDTLARQVLETSYDAFIALDEGGAITEWNARAGVLFGWSRDEVLGRDLADLLIPEAGREAHRRGIERFVTTGEERVLGRRRELMVCHRDGYEFLVEVTISAIQTPSGYSFNAFLRDITERRAAQEELRQARHAALQASRMKSMFVANVSHEIRTPMNGVIGMTELLLDTDLDARQRDFAETISSSGEALLAIIDDILDLSKIEAGKLDLDVTDFDPRDAIERACGMLAARAHERDLELVVAIGPEVPALVYGDRARLRQIVANLVANAIKFTAAGEIAVRVTARPAGEAAAVVRIDVSDTGIGISGEALARLFKPFAQADESTTRRYGGTGLGLAISKQLVELMGGRLGAVSTPGVGSRFWLELTLARAAAHAQPESRERLSGLRALVVDDNATARELLARQLRDLRMRCDVAGDGHAARERMRSASDAGDPYALALLDARLSLLDGHAAVRDVGGAGGSAATRIVLLSSGVRPEPTSDAAFDGTLAKPVRQSRLYDELVAIMFGAAEGVAHAAGDRRAPARSCADILVAEDGEVNQRVVAHMLVSCGFRAHIADNGRRALEVLSERSFAAVLMDCQMPELDGYQTAREIRRREQGGVRVPIIAMTANSMQGERERCLAAGMDDYLTKPLRSQTLRTTLDRWIADPSPADRDRTAPSPASADPVLDAQVVADLADLGDGTLRELLELYFEEASADIRELAEAIGRADAPAIGRTAHRLRGTGATIGAARMSRIASELETTARAGDITATARLFGELRRGLQTTRAAFAGRATEPVAGGDGPIAAR